MKTTAAAGPPPVAAATTTMLSLLALPAQFTLLALLAACAGSPPTQWYELRSTPPQAAAAAAASPSSTTAAAADTTIWTLSPRITLPGALDRDQLMVARGSAGLEPLPGHRWAEPLRDSLPRLLLADLQRLRGADRVWAAPPPAGVLPARRLVVGIDRLQVTADRGSLALVAQAQWQDGGAVATPSAAPMTQRIELRVPIDGASVDAIAAAHRLALWQLAQRLAAGPPAP